MQDATYEQWRRIPAGADQFADIGNFFEVSNLGRIRKIDGDVYAQALSDRGYSTVGLSISGWVKRFRVHRLVAMAFIPNPEDKPDINHISGDKSDNRVANLEWVTPRENLQHALETGLYRSGDGHCKAILCAAEVREIKAKRAAGARRQKLADEYGVSINTIKAILAGRTWKDVA